MNIFSYGYQAKGLIQSYKSDTQVIDFPILNYTL